MTTFATAQYIVSTAAQELGLGSISISAGVDDAIGYQTLGMLNALGEEVLRAHDWQNMEQIMTFTGDGSSTTFPMPSDFGRQVNQTQWSTSNQRPMQGPDSPQLWSWSQYGIVAVGVFFRYRVLRGQYSIFPTPGLGEEFAMYYIGRNWVEKDITGYKYNVTDPAVVNNLNYNLVADLGDAQLNNWTPVAGYAGMICQLELGAGTLNTATNVSLVVFEESPDAGATWTLSSMYDMTNYTGHSRQNIPLFEDMPPTQFGLEFADTTTHIRVVIGGISLLTGTTTGLVAYALFLPHTHNNTDTAVIGSATTLNPYIMTDSVVRAGDIPQFDRRLMIAGLKARLWAQKGFDSVSLQAEFNYMLDNEKAAIQGARVINLGGDNGSYLLGYGNVPDGNTYGN